MNLGQKTLSIHNWIYEISISMCSNLFHFKWLKAEKLFCSSTGGINKKFAKCHCKKLLVNVQTSHKNVTTESFEMILFYMKLKISLGDNKFQIFNTQIIFFRSNLFSNKKIHIIFPFVSSSSPKKIHLLQLERMETIFMQISSAFLHCFKQEKTKKRLYFHGKILW